MKLTNKRLVSILLCLAMVLALLPMAVFAADTTTVYYYNANGWSQVAAYWWGSSSGNNPGWPGNVMNDLGNGYWSYDVPSDLVGKEGLIFNNNNKGSQTSNLTIPTTGENCFDGTKWINYTGESLEVSVDYFVVGSMNGWTASDAYKMTDNGDGTLSLTLDLAAGSYEYKVKNTQDKWFPGGDNAKLTLDADDTVTFIFNTANSALSYTLGSGSVVEVLYYVVGDFNGWGEANKMTANDDGSYSATFAVAAGTYGYKVKNSNNEWFPGVDNLSLEVTSDCDVTFVLSNGVVTATGDGVAAPVYDYFVAGSAGLVGVEWDPAQNQMTDNGNGVYAITFENIAAGSYEFKVTTGSWDTPSYGDGGENYALTVDKDGSTVTICFVAESSNILVDVVAPVAGSTAPDAMILGSNVFGIANGDTNAVTSTYVVEKAGLLSVAPSAMTTPDGEVPVEYIPMQFGRMYALLVNGEQVWLPCEIEVAAGDVVEVGVMSYMGTETSITIDLAIREPGANDIKWQVPVIANETDDFVDLRLVSWVDTLDYSNVQFTVTIGEYTGTLDVTTVYETIYGEAYATYTPYGVFGDDANYFVTHTITGIPAAYFNEEIEVTVSFYDLDGNLVRTSETRTIVIAENW